MTQVHHHRVKFRWTENLTSRFIQLRRENGKLFTGRKYSAQAGWEYILRQMRQEFPTIMADVHYRVLKKKWSNLLQQYKELKKPVHGDKNKADDVSWPFYGAIDEVLGKNTTRSVRPEKTDDSYEDDEVDPREFLCVSVTPEESATEEEPIDLGRSDDDDKNNDKRASRKNGRVAKSRANQSSLNRARSSQTVSVKDLSKLRERGDGGGKCTRNGNTSSISDRNGLDIDLNDDDGNNVVREVKRWRRTRENEEQSETRLERRIEQFVNYAERRDADNRDIMLRILQAVEKIANKLH